MLKVSIKAGQVFTDFIRNATAATGHKPSQSGEISEQAERLERGLSPMVGAAIQRSLNELPGQWLFILYVHAW